MTIVFWNWYFSWVGWICYVPWWWRLWMTSWVDHHEVKTRDEENHHMLMMFQSRSPSEEDHHVLMILKSRAWSKWCIMCWCVSRSLRKENHHVLMMFKKRRWSWVDHQVKRRPIMCWWRSSKGCIMSWCMLRQWLGLEVKMCVIKLQEDGQSKGITS